MSSLQKTQVRESRLRDSRGDCFCGRPADVKLPFGSKVPKYGLCRVSIMGIVILLVHRYFVFGYAEPWVCNRWILDGQSK